MGKFVISQAKNGVKFNLKAANGEVIASSQVYKDEKYCRKGIASVINNAPIALIEDQTVEGFTPVSIQNLRFIRIRQANSASA